MCGRYTLTNPEEALAEALAEPPQVAVAARYNIAPTEQVLTVRATRQVERQGQVMRWGLVPPGSAEPDKIGGRYINARSETVSARGLFKGSFKWRRCLVLADGFYEWQKLGGARQPHYFRLASGKPFAFAGIWAKYESPERTFESCSILTTTPNALVAPIHDRMPAILRPDQYTEWLTIDGSDPEPKLALIGPYDADLMESYTVSTAVNRAGQEDPSFVEPIDPEPRNLSLFD